MEQEFTPEKMPQAEPKPENPQPQGPSTAEGTLPQKAEELTLREQALAQRERRLLAKEELSRRGLPAQLADQLPCHSDEALQQSLRLTDSLFALARLQAAQDQVPRLARPDSQAAHALGYGERAALYLQDPTHYQQLFGGR